MARSSKQVTVTGVATLLLAFNANRTSACLTNTGPVTVFTGPDTTVTTTSGDELYSGMPENYEKKEGDDTISPLYGITAGTSAVVTVEEDTD